MSQPVFTHHWDLAKLSEALGLPAVETKAFFIDGRRGGFLLEGVVRDYLKGALANKTEAPYDVLDSAGGRWEVRALTVRGIRFNPSNQQGAGRMYNELTFLAKVAGVIGYYIADLTHFPDVPFYRVPSSAVLTWHRSGALHSAHMTYLQAKTLFAG
jgi:hypothetical protein